jgi:erythrocyte band 7 integral membrane protein
MLIKDIVFSQELQESLSMAAQSKRTGEAKIITARAEVVSARHLRAAADILSSAPAMQIRYLDAMVQMSKQAGSKVIFLPAPNQMVQHQMQMADSVGEGPSAYGVSTDFSTGTEGLQGAINSHVVENM